MQYKNNIKQRNKTIQGLRSFKDTLPTSVKKIISKKGHILSETLSNWKYIIGNELFKFCYPKSFKSSNRFGVSTLLIMVKRGKEVELEYSKNKIIDKINSYFGYTVVEKLKFVSFDDNSTSLNKSALKNTDVTKSKYMNKIIEIKNDKVKKSLIELTKIFKKNEK